jgi:hypothetical protein
MERSMMAKGCRNLLVYCLLLIGAMAPVWAQKGINGNELYLQSEAELADTVAGYQRLGVKWVRFDFDWSVMEPRPGKYVFRPYDRVAARLARADIRILGLIAYTPGWANGGKAGKYHPPRDPAAFARFAATLAARYAPRGIDTWEVWNEPNLGQFWGNASDAAAYTTLLKLTYRAIKQANPGAFVVSGGLAQPATSATSVDSLEFLMAMYRHGAQGHFDALGNHPYTTPRIPGEWLAYNWRKMTSTSPSMLSVMTRHGDGNKKIWITEFGAPTAGKSPWGTVIDEQQQAAMVQQTYAAAAAAPWAGPVFWYNYRDFCVYAKDADAECFFGLLRHDGTPKPAYDSYRRVPSRTALPPSH